MISPRSACAALLFSVAFFHAAGGDLTAKDVVNQEPASQGTPISWETEASFSGVFGSDFKGVKDTGKVEALDTELRLLALIPTHDGGPQLRFGFDLQRFDFSRPDSTPLPSSLESLAFVLGMDFQYGSDWIGRFEVKPGFYGSNNEIRGRDFNAPVNLGVSYIVNADLQLIVGLSVDANRKYPFIPAVGARWKFAPDWVLNAVLPAPRLEYTLNSSLTLYAGADFQGDTYHTSDVPGDSHRAHRLDDAIVDYTQIRVGAGTSWSINNQFTVELEAGFVPIHDFDFHRADGELRSKDVPPYAGISLKAEF